MQAIKTNPKWFRDRLAERNMSLRQLAKRIDLDPSAVSLTFRGRRKMTLKEANTIAVLLGLPVTEVIRQAGIDVAQDVQGVRLTGYVDGKSSIKNIPANQVRAIVGPPDVPHDGFALQIRAASNFYDGWMVYVGPQSDMPWLCLDRICVVSMTGGQRVVGTLRRGYEEDTYNIVPLLDPSGLTVLDNQKVEGVSPVLWLRPQ